MNNLARRSAREQEQEHESGGLEEVLAGLHGEPKRLPCKLLYDARGSALFERITQLPEYYCTRVELAILRLYAGEMARCLGAERLLVELGSGSSRKTRLLLARLVRPIAYVPARLRPPTLSDLRSRCLDLRATRTVRWRRAQAW